VTGADFVLLVGEPSLSGMHDLKRVAELCAHFEVPAGLCINKADLNEELADELAADAERLGLPVLGRIRYDPAVTAAQVRLLSVVEHGPSPAADDVRELWQRVSEQLASPGGRASRNAGDGVIPQQEAPRRAT
jgi:MinD superfamily P-loop ATPase